MGDKIEQVVTEEERRPKFRVTECPRCKEEAVEMYKTDMQIIWCACGHITVVEEGKQTEVSGFGCSD